MSDSFSQWAGFGNGQGDKGQGPRRDDGPDKEGPTAQGRAQETDSDQPEYAHAADTSAVLDKAVAIAHALNHSELTIAHLIAAIALTPRAADPFNHGRLKRGAAPLNIERALQASLKFLLKHVKSHTGEQAKPPLRSREVKDVFYRASEFVVERAAQHRNIEISDALKVLVETELSESFRQLLLDDSGPTMSTLLETIEKLGESLKQTNFSAAGTLTFSIDAIRRALDNHVANFKDVVSAAAAIPSPRYGDPSAFASDQIRPATETDFVKLRDIVAAVDKVRVTSDLRLGTIIAALEKMDATLAAHSAALAKANAEIASLRTVCSIVLTITAVLALSTIAVIGLVGYKMLS